jgi:hypothetical protein
MKPSGCKKYFLPFQGRSRFSGRVVLFQIYISHLHRNKNKFVLLIFLPFQGRSRFSGRVVLFQIYISHLHRNENKFVLLIFLPFQGRSRFSGRGVLLFKQRHRTESFAVKQPVVAHFQFRNYQQCHE